MYERVNMAKNEILRYTRVNDVMSARKAITVLHMKHRSEKDSVFP
jgi:hypothetical protein